MPKKFGLQYSSFLYPDRDEGIYSHVAQVALEAERLGFDSLMLADHFYSAIGPPQEPYMETWTLLGALAATTNHIRLGSLVTANLFRNPALVAKMGASVDVISGGRLIMGIGSGNLKQEYDMYGVPFGTNADRLGRLEEAVQIIHKMWTEDTSQFEGKYYQINDAICSPKPVQQPRPPILIGGDGEKVTLRLAAQYGDMCNIHGDPATIRHKLDVLEAHCNKLGRDPDEIVKSRHSFMIIGENEAEVEVKVERYLTETSLERSAISRFDIGTAAQMQQLCGELFEAGLDYLIVNFRRDWGVEPLQLFAEQVMPGFD